MHLPRQVKSLQYNCRLQVQLCFIKLADHTLHCSSVNATLHQILKIHVF